MSATPQTPPPLHRLLLCGGVCAVALGVMGNVCATQRHSAVSLAPSEARTSWDRTVEDWSRRHQVYDWMDDKMDARATYHSPAFRKSYLDHAAGFHGDFAELERKELIELGGGEAEQFHSFFVATYIGTRKYRQLTHSRTIWTLYLENDEGVSVKAENFRDVAINAAVTAVYPYTTFFDRGYLVRFPLADREGRPVITSHTRQFKMRIASAYATAELVWDLVPGSVREDYGMPRDAGPQDAAKSLEDSFGLGKILGGN